MFCFGIVLAIEKSVLFNHKKHRYEKAKKRDRYFKEGKK